MPNCASECEHMSEVPGYWVAAHKSAGLVGLGWPLPLPLFYPYLYLPLVSPYRCLTPCLSPFPLLPHRPFLNCKKSLAYPTGARICFEWCSQKKKALQELLQEEPAEGDCYGFHKRKEKKKKAVGVVAWVDILIESHIAFALPCWLYSAVALSVAAHCFAPGQQCRANPEGCHMPRWFLWHLSRSVAN